jgi:hypothetical protein
MKAYMIRHKATGKWSKGGQRVVEGDPMKNCYWAEKQFRGKIWKGIGPLKNHLRQFSETQQNKWEIVEINLDME